MSSIAREAHPALIIFPFAHEARDRSSRRHSPISFRVIYNGRMNTPIETYSLTQLQELVARAGQPRFRTKQLVEWLYRHNVSSYDEMTNLPTSFRSFLAEEAPLAHSEIKDRRISSDGTRKYVFELYDGALVEAVGIPSHGSKERLTVCFSTQVGCAMACAFCATGTEGFTRNLGMGEILRQIIDVQEDMGCRVTNLVGMGQGEPFFNYDHVRDALQVANDPHGLEIGARRITVSTCGIIPGIQRFEQEPQQYTLAVSLHAARQTVRDMLMPKAARYSLLELKQALGSYTNKTNRRVTLEYLMIDGVNDSLKDRDALETFCSNLLCHINFLPMNAVSDSPFQPSPDRTVEAWLDHFNRNGIEATLRTSRGSDIEGACGQLKNALGRIR